jgi:Fe-S cluster assembly protein SufD
MASYTAEEPTVTLERVNTPPAQTWNYLKTNDITLTVPKLSRKGDVYFALPRLFDKVETGMGQKVTDWVTSQAADSTYVEVKAGEKNHAPIVVDVDSNAGTVQDAGVLIRQGASATVVVVAHGTSAEPQTSAALVRIIVEEGAHLSLVEVVATTDAHQHLESVGIRADAGATLDIRQFLLGAGVTALGTCATLAGGNGRVDLQTHYLGEHEQTLDINHVVRMAGKNGRAEVHENGILNDSARKSLRATIDLIHGGSGSKGNEAETVLVNGDGVVNKTMPVILCDEDDVQGNHGATIGSVEPEQIDYLMDRGLSREEATNLFVRALFDDALIEADQPLARKAVFERAQQVLGAEVAQDLLDTLGLELAADAPAADAADAGEKDADAQATATATKESAD